MILFSLIFISIILIAVHAVLSLTEDKQDFENHEPIIDKEKVISEKQNNKPVQREIDEQEFLNYGKVIANEQKIKIIDNRMNNVEKVLAEVTRKQFFGGEELDYEKIDFRLKLLEKEVEKIKKPEEKKNTFFGKENDEMEETIKALAFNSKKK